MNTRNWIVLMAVVVALEPIFVIKFHKTVLKDIKGQQSIPGTDLKLVAKYEPLHLYIYVDTNSTNKLPDYAIAHGDEALISSENTLSNTLTTTYYEHGLGLLETIRGNNGRFLRRSVAGYNGNSSQRMYSYIDTNGTGQFDVFIRYGESGDTTTMFVRSNFCWVPVQQRADSR